MGRAALFLPIETAHQSAIIGIVHVAEDIYCHFGHDHQHTHRKIMPERMPVTQTAEFPASHAEVPMSVNLATTPELQIWWIYRCASTFCRQRYPHPKS